MVRVDRSQTSCPMGAPRSDDAYDAHGVAFLRPGRRASVEGKGALIRPSHSPAGRDDSGVTPRAHSRHGHDDPRPLPRPRPPRDDDLHIPIKTV